MLVAAWLAHRLAQPQVDVTADAIDELLRTVLASPGEAESQRLLRDRLRSLENAFKLASQGIKLVMVQSERDRPDLVRLLVRQQITFTYQLTRLRLRLAFRLSGAGLAGNSQQML